MESFGDPSILKNVQHALAMFEGELGFYAKNLRTAEEVGLDADDVMPTASVIKVGVMAELYRQAEAGEVDLGSRVAVTSADWYGGTGVLKELAPGIAPTVADLCRLMIIQSDNVATSMLVRLVGKERVNASLLDWGLPDTELRMNMTLGGDIEQYAVSTPRQLGRLMELIATDGFLTPDACAAMRDHLGRQQHLEQIPRGLPYNQYALEIGAEQPYKVMNKIGNYMGMRVDAAIVTGSGTSFVLTTMNRGNSDHGFSVDQPGNILNGQIGRIVFDAWTS